MHPFPDIIFYYNFIVINIYLFKISLFLGKPSIEKVENPQLDKTQEGIHF